MDVHTGLFSQVLVQFAGIVLIKDESNSDVTATTWEENTSEPTSEEQQSKEDSTRTGVAKQTAGEDWITRNIKVIGAELIWTTLKWWFQPVSLTWTSLKLNHYIWQVKGPVCKI